VVATFTLTSTPTLKKTAANKPVAGDGK
jgi:hypothetical protein